MRGVIYPLTQAAMTPGECPQFVARAGKLSTHFGLVNPAPGPPLGGDEGRDEATQLHHPLDKMKGGCKSGLSHPRAPPERASGEDQTGPGVWRTQPAIPNQTKPHWRSSRETCAGWYSTPKVSSMNWATRSVVQRSPRPWASAPSASI